MSFFKRNDPTAPAARRAAAGGPPGGSPYERLPADNGSHPSLQAQPGLPPRRSPVPPAQPDFSTPYHAQQRSQPSSQDYGRGLGAGGSPYDQYQNQRKPSYGYPSEKAEYQPQQSPQRGMHAPSAGSGRGM